MDNTKLMCRKVFADRDEYRISDKEAVDRLRAILQPATTRLDFVRSRYVADPFFTTLYSRATSKEVKGKNVRCGEQQSPVTVNKALWMLAMNEDPYLVGYDLKHGLYAIYLRGGPRFYLKDRRGAAFLRPRPDKPIRKAK